VKNESDTFRDIIIENFVDTYNNLTVKTLRLLKWVKNNCKNTDYIMKADDDIYINMENLALFINGIPKGSSRDNILYGNLLCSSKPILDPSSKW